MSGNRRDSKGRILRAGETQRSDGRYMYRYTDADGVRRSVYSWRLVETDKMPAGKKEDIPLRIAIKQITRDIEDGIVAGEADGITVNDLFDSFMEFRTDLKERTRMNYFDLYNKHVRDGFGCKLLGKVKYSDLKRFYFVLNSDHGLSVSTIQSINAIISQMFEVAKRDNIIRSNPADGVMKEVMRRVTDDKEPRQALTIEQQNRLIDFIAVNKKYCEYSVIITVLLGTGMRIGELLGLRWCDIDFKKGIIYVTHSLAYRPTESTGYVYSINEPKTKAGIREIPMFDDVKKALQKEKRKKKGEGDEPFCIGKYSGFIFLNAAGKVYTPSAVYDKIQFIVDDYNKTEQLRVREEKCTPVYIPKISPHIFRHTFCTRLCELEPNIKVVQEVMGHRNAKTTMNVYYNATREAKMESFKALDGKIRLA